MPSEPAAAKVSLSLCFMVYESNSLLQWTNPALLHLTSLLSVKYRPQPGRGEESKEGSWIRDKMSESRSSKTIKVSQRKDLLANEDSDQLNCKISTSVLVPVASHNHWRQGVWELASGVT